MGNLLYIIAICLLLISYTLRSSYAAFIFAPSSLVIATAPESTEVKALLLSFDEINGIDKSNLKSSDTENCERNYSIKRWINGLKNGLKEEQYVF
ncbi:MAG: hypothetical protein Q8K02_07555 [Flavobacterium sp.]|nr:hypothetical protein [Flavobacterium sp.]